MQLETLAVTRGSRSIMDGVMTQIDENILKIIKWKFPKTSQYMSAKNLKYLSEFETEELYKH